MDELLAEIWADAKPTLLERCEVIRLAATAGDETTFDAARAESHRLAGAVGMFGLTEASGLAAELDALVSAGALADDRRGATAEIVARLAVALEDER